MAAPLPGGFDALKAAAREVGSVQIQNRGTVAGNLCNASPAADSVPPLLALDAGVELTSPRGARLMPLADFILGNRRPSGADEILTAILVPRTIDGPSAFLKLGARRYLVISIAMVAAALERDGDGAIAEARIAVGSCSAVAQRLPAARARLIGHAASRSRRPRRGAAISPARRRSTISARPPLIGSMRRAPWWRAPSSCVGRGARMERHDRAATDFTLNGRAVAGRAPRRRALSAGAARRVRPDRHQGRLRCRRLRRLHRAARRRAGLRLPGGGGPGRRPRGRDDRGLAAGIRHDSAPAGAFLHHGAAQCGICTPGMLVAATALLDRNPEPTRERRHGCARRRALPLHRLSQDRRRVLDGGGHGVAPNARRRGRRSAHASTGSTASARSTARRSSAPTKRRRCLLLRAVRIAAIIARASARRHSRLSWPTIPASCASSPPPTCRERIATA